MAMLTMVYKLGRAISPCTYYCHVLVHTIAVYTRLLTTILTMAIHTRSRAAQSRHVLTIAMYLLYHVLTIAIYLLGRELCHLALLLYAYYYTYFHTLLGRELCHLAAHPPLLRATHRIGRRGGGVAPLFAST